jgi:hypothetical protein
VSDSQTIGITNPATGDPVRTGDIIPQPAIDPRTGRLYVVWQDSRANAVDPNEDGLFISTSSHGGLTGSWSRPAVVNDPRDEAAFTPAIKVLPSGAVVVQYYTLQQQHHPSRRDTLPTSIVVRTTDGPGTSFTHREQSVGDDFNMLAAPFAGGYFTGDYEGLTVDLRDPTSVHTFFTATNCLDSRCAAVQGFDGDGNPIPSNAPNPTDVFSGSARVG